MFHKILRLACTYIILSVLSRFSSLVNNESRQKPFFVNALSRFKIALWWCVCSSISWNLQMHCSDSEFQNQFGKREIWEHIVHRCFSFFGSPELHSNSVIWCDYLEQDVPEMLPIGWQRVQEDTVLLLSLFYFTSSWAHEREREDYIWFHRLRLWFKLKDSGD